MSLFRKPEPPPENDAFSVVSGRVRTAAGEVRPIQVTVPTVFGGSSSLLEMAIDPHAMVGAARRSGVNRRFGG